ncbi:MAG: hypothetical protein ACE5KJ_04065 [Candidatus Zixiibacteriota bacterium]
MSISKDLRNLKGVLKKLPCHFEGVHKDKLRDGRISLIHMKILPIWVRMTLY